MKSFIKACLLSVICAALCTTVSGKTSCYSCTSASVGDDAGSDKCASFNPLSPPPVKECLFEGACTKTVVQADGVVSSVTRGCAPLGVCTDLNKDGNGLFCCDGNKCNNGERCYLTISFLLLSLLSYIL